MMSVITVANVICVINMCKHAQIKQRRALSTHIIVFWTRSQRLSYAADIVAMDFSVLK